MHVLRFGDPARKRSDPDGLIRLSDVKMVLREQGTAALQVNSRGVRRAARHVEIAVARGLDQPSLQIKHPRLVRSCADCVVNGGIRAVGAMPTVQRTLLRRNLGMRYFSNAFG